MIKEGDKIRLRTGEIALVSEVLEQGVMYIGEIIRADGHVDIDHIAYSEIAGVFEETYHPLTKAV